MPDKKQVNRKLSAILSADVKGYSVLMTGDEVHTIETLKAYKQIISELVSKHSGRVVDSPGDNILAEFRSSVDAVECAVKIQKGLDQENSKYSDDKKVQFRIGVNVGDVIHDGEQIYGNGVNVAARIEGLAEPGGICISRNAYDHIKNKLTLGYEYIGEHSVKNIKDPVRVYKLLMADKDAGKLIGDKPKPLVNSRIWATIVIAAVVITSVVILVYQNISKPEFEPASVENLAFPLPEKPSIAVLAFDNMTGDPDQNYFCDGFTEHIISTLSYIPDLSVISRRSTFAYKDKSLNVKQIGVELGADWIIEGSVQKSDQRIRITVQLIEANTGHHRWAETYDREFDDIFKLQDDIAFRILEEMQIELTSSEGFRNIFDGINSVDEYKKALKILEVFFNDFTLEGLKRAEQKIHDLLTMNPNIPFAHTLLAEIYLQYIWQNNCTSFINCIGKASESVEKAIKINENFDFAYVALGKLSMMMGEYEKAKAAVKKAMLINPSNAEAYSTYGEILLCQSQFNEAVVQIEKAIRLNPLPNWWYYLNLGQIYQYMENFSKAIEYYNKSIQLYPNHWGNYAGLVVSYSMLGDMDKANIAKSKLLSIRPDFTLSQFLKVLPLQNKEAREIITASFKKSGIPD